MRDTIKVVFLFQSFLVLTVLKIFNPIFLNNSLQILTIILSYKLETIFLNTYNNTDQPNFFLRSVEIQDKPFLRITFKERKLIYQLINDISLVYKAYTFYITLAPLNPTISTSVKDHCSTKSRF